MLDRRMSAELDRWLTTDPNEPDGSEEKCESCLDNLCEETAIGNIPDWVIETKQGCLCLDCFKINLKQEFNVEWEALVQIVDEFRPKEEGDD